MQTDVVLCSRTANYLSWKLFFPSFEEKMQTFFLSLNPLVLNSLCSLVPQSKQVDSKRTFAVPECRQAHQCAMHQNAPKGTLTRWCLSRCTVHRYPLAYIRTNLMNMYILKLTFAVPGCPQARQCTLARQKPPFSLPAVQLRRGRRPVHIHRVPALQNMSWESSTTV